MDYIENNLDKPWPYVRYLKNINLTIDLIEKYPDKPDWSKYLISKNPNIIPHELKKGVQKKLI